MKTLTYKEIRDKYIDFFKSKGHTEIPNASLIPEDDPSVLFVNAGMFPLVPFLKGEKHPNGNRLTNSQRCVRTGDIDNVGNNFHCTSFEMLGNWSLNDYYKKDAINFTVEFLTEELGIDINRIYTTVYEGDSEIPRDDESIEIWKDIFSKNNIEPTIGENGRIMPKGREENWWGLESGGPCGPDNEIFYKTDDGELVEIGNNVFMEYLLENNEFKDLGIKNVDFGGGLERITSLIQNTTNYYDIDIYKPILKAVQKLSQNPNTKSERIITDHIKASTLIIMDGIRPSRSEQGYILRRLIRRSVRHAKLLGINKPFTGEIASVAINQFSPIYAELLNKQDEIIRTIEEEEFKFNKTLENGLRELDKMLNTEKEIDGKKAFQLYETYGLPIEVTEEILNEKGKQILNKESFYTAEEEHQNKSRTASKGLFKGGLADTSEMSTKYHTATHLLLTALRKVLGEHVYQMGSNITPERLRLDFPNEQKLTPEEITKVEEIVNEAIKAEHEITYEEYDKEEALKIIEKHSSVASFTDRYGDRIKIYYVGTKENPFSVEICNGPHVQNTRELGNFKIAKQENVGAGIKRIKAVLE